jgi:hypothetical protein
MGTVAKVVKDRETGVVDGYLASRKRRALILFGFHSHALA